MADPSDAETPVPAADASDDEAELFPEGECPACDQKFQAQDEDFWAL